MEERTIAVAGGSGFIGRAIVRSLGADSSIRIRVLSRHPEKARNALWESHAEFVAADVTVPSSVCAAIAGADTIIDTVQFDGYPVEKPRRGLTFDRIDLGAVRALLTAAVATNTRQFIYISGAAADEASRHPAFRAKGLAERAIRESGLTYTIFRPSLVYGPGDAVISNFARLLRIAPIFAVPGTGKQRLQPVHVDDLAACVAMAVSGRGRNGIYDVGGPDLMTFDEMTEAIMTAIGRRRRIVHIPERMLRAMGAIAERLPGPLFSRDAAAFVIADNVCDPAPLTAEFGVSLRTFESGLDYLTNR